MPNESILTLTNFPPAGSDPVGSFNIPTEVFVGFWELGGTSNWVKSDLIPQWMTWSTAESGMGRAQLLNRYGERWRTGDETNEYSLITRTSHRFQFVKIVLGGDGETKVGDVEEVPPGGSLFRRVWIGQIDFDAGALAGSAREHPTGTQILIANAIENTIFGKHFVLTSKYTEFNAASATVQSKSKICQHGITFNERGQPNRLLDAFNVSTFMTRQNRGHSTTIRSPTYWSTRDIVQYALLNWTPIDSTGNKLFNVRISDEDLYRLPSWDAPVIETHGYRPLEILRRLVSRRRLLVWWLEVREDLRTDPDGLTGLPTIWFRVETTTSTPIQATSQFFIPANDNEFAIDADDDANAEVQLEVDDGSWADQVVCQGARRRNVMTLDFETDPTPSQPNPIAIHRGDKYWFPSIQAEYEQAASLIQEYKDLKTTDRDEKKRLNDLERSRDKYKDVFRRFGMTFVPGLIDYPIKPDIAGVAAWATGVKYTVGDLVKDSGNIFEVLTATGNKSTGTSPTTDTEHTYEIFYENCFGQLHLIQKLPLLENHDYSGTNIANGTTVNTTIGPTPPQELDMFVIFLSDSKEPGKDEVTSRYIWGAKTSQLGLNPPKIEEDRDWSTTARVVRDDTSFLLTVSGKDTKPHTIAKGTFIPLIDSGFEVWAVAQTYVIGKVVQDSNEKYFKVTAGSGPSAGDDTDLGGGSDTGYSYAVTFEPLPMDIDNEEVGKVDWRKMKATIAYEDDRFCESVYPPVIVGTVESVRVLRIDMGDDYKLDWVEKDTVIDIDATGNLVKSNGGFIRDDRLELEEITRRAYGYYSSIRGKLTLKTDYGNIASGLTLGRMISRVRNGSLDVEPVDTNPPNFQPNWRIVDTVITEIRVDLPYSESQTPIDRLGRPTMQIQTSFGELDPKFFVRTAK